MVTADEARRLRVNRGAINHQTYKEIHGKISNRIKAAAAQGHTDIDFRIPPFVPGRPIYDITHAARYASEKLKNAGFRVEVDHDTVSVDWKPAPRPRPRPRPSPRAGAGAPRPEKKKKDAADAGGLSRQFGTAAGISQKLADLKNKLKW